MCIDFRQLNGQTIKNRCALPRIDELFDNLHGASIFSSADSQSAYNQVRFKPEDTPKTAFTTPFSLFEFKVLCFGLTNAPGTFQNVMNDVLKHTWCVGKTKAQHLELKQTKGSTTPFRLFEFKPSRGCPPQLLTANQSLSTNQRATSHFPSRRKQCIEACT